MTLVEPRDNWPKLWGSFNEQWNHIRVYDDIYIYINNVDIDMFRYVSVYTYYVYCIIFV